MVLLVVTVLSRSENVLGSKELEALPRIEESPRMGAREARAEAMIGERKEEEEEKEERKEESLEKRETGSSPCWYS